MCEETLPQPRSVVVEIVAEEAVQYRNLSDPSQHGLVEAINRSGSKNSST